MRKKLFIVILILALATAAFISIRYYSYVFAKSVRGEILKVERVNQNETIISSGASNVPAAQIFSFAVAIRGENGEIFTASSEDRQWAVAQPGQCAQARFLPYPFWDFEKAGTFHGARLIQLFDCPNKSQSVKPSP